MELQAQIGSNANLIESMMKSFEEKLKEMRAQSKDNEEIYDYSAPHLVNVNEDPLLNGKIFLNLLAIPMLHVGRKEAKPKPHIR